MSVTGIHHPNPLFGARGSATTGDVTSYAQLHALLRKQFGPKGNTMVERFTFRQRGQQQGEPVRQYVFALRELATWPPRANLVSSMMR